MIIDRAHMRDPSEDGSTTTDAPGEPPTRRRRRSAGRIIALLLAALAAVAGSAGAIAGFRDMIQGRDVAVSVLVGLTGYCSLAALWHAGADDTGGGETPFGKNMTEALLCEPAGLASVDPSRVGVPRWSEPQRLERGGVTMERAIDVALRAWMTAGGADGLVVVAGDSREDTSSTAWNSLRACFPSATVLAVRAPSSNGNAAAATQPLVALGEFVQEAHGLGEVVVWIEHADAHLDRGLTIECLRQLHESLPGGLIVMTMPWDALIHLSQTRPDLADWMWRATENLRVRAN
jgi:hypothetical protein